ncbi:RNA polymerase sigma factor [Zavarzinella formosa]|uniref:RNA polymerase sigma factor n=1 Tax=Zavarzinella formosa TaxID=360055 RepID=UPI0002EC70C2|nr:sigma-70 family RNA polymerase sigma factor [Zavarzinella formosa]
MTVDTDSALTVQLSERCVYGEYAQRLKGFIRSQLAADMAGREDEEDIMQSVFRTFWRGVSESRYAVPDSADLWNLLSVLARHKVIAHATRHRAIKRDVRQTRSLTDLETTLSFVDSRAADPVLEAVVRDLMEKLLPVHREMIELRCQGFEVAEIARVTNRSKRTVERILQQSREAILEQITQHD